MTKLHEIYARLIMKVKSNGWALGSDGDSDSTRKVRVIVVTHRVSTVQCEYSLL